MCENKFEKKQEKQTMEQAGLQWRQAPEDFVEDKPDLELVLNSFSYSFLSKFFFAGLVITT